MVNKLDTIQLSNRACDVNIGYTAFGKEGGTCQYVKFPGIPGSTCSTWVRIARSHELALPVILTYIGANSDCVAGRGGGRL